MKGIILVADDTGGPIPIHSIAPDQMLPIYDKPAIYYNLSLLMSAGITEILIIAHKHDKSRIKEFLDGGEQFGITIKYQTIKNAKTRIDDAILLADKFVKNENFMLVFGSVILVGKEVQEIIAEAVGSEGATIFCKHVENPQNHVIVTLNEDGTVKSVDNRPTKPESDLAIVGLYYFDNNALDFIKKSKQQDKDGFEISTTRKYLMKKKLNVKILPQTVFQEYVSTPQSMLNASNNVDNIQKESGVVGSPELTALRMGFISKNQLLEWIAKSNENGSPYYEYILRAIATM